MSYLLAVLQLAAALTRPHSGLGVDTELLLGHVEAVDDPPIAVNYDQPLAELVQIHRDLGAPRLTLCLCHLDLRTGSPFVRCPAADGAPPRTSLGRAGRRPQPEPGFLVGPA